MNEMDLAKFKEEVDGLGKTLKATVPEAEALEQAVVPELRACQLDPYKESEIDLKLWVEKLVTLEKAFIGIQALKEQMLRWASDTDDEGIKNLVYTVVTDELDMKLKRMESTFDHGYFLVQRQRIAEPTLNEWGVSTDIYGRVRATEYAETRRQQPPRKVKRNRQSGDVPRTPPTGLRDKKKRRMESERRQDNLGQGDRGLPGYSTSGICNQLEANQSDNQLESDEEFEELSDSDEPRVEYMEQEEREIVPSHSRNRDTSTSGLERQMGILCDLLRKQMEFGGRSNRDTHTREVNNSVDYRGNLNPTHPAGRGVEYNGLKRHETQQDFDLHCLRSEVINGKLHCRCDPNNIQQAAACSPANGNELTKYTGKCPADWNLFVASFNALIGLNPRYPPVVKYRILREKVEYRDEKMIANSSITSRSYARSWEWLHQSHAKPMSCLKYIRSVLMKIHIKIDRASLPNIRRLWDGVCELREAGYDMKDDDLRGVIMGTLTEELRRSIRSCAEVGKLGGYKEIAADDLAREIFDFVSAEVEDKEAYEGSYHPGKSAQAQSFGLNSHKDASPRFGQGTSGFHHKSKRLSCFFCQDNHPAIVCSKYQTSAARINRARENGRCTRCLVMKHEGPCRIGTCAKCGEKHHIALCSKPRPATGGNSVPLEESKKRVVAAMAEGDSGENLEMPANVFMTLDLQISKTRTGSSRPLRAALDTHSSMSFITLEKARELNLELGGEEMTPLTVFGNVSNPTKGYRTVAYMHLDQQEVIPINLFAVEEIIAPYPMLERVPQDIDQLFKWDPRGSLIKRAPDLLLNTSNTLQLHPQYLHAQLECGLSLIQTRMGYLVCGGTKEDPMPTTLLINTSDIREMTPEQRCIKRLYDMEHLGVVDADFNQTEEEMVVQKFMRELTVDQEGRYQVKLPVKECINQLGSNKYITTQMTESLRRRILRDPEAQAAYDDTFKKYLEEGILTEVLDDTLPEGAIGEHYLPHHPVRKEESNTTKVRIVVNPTTKSSKNGISLNDALFKGRTDLPTIFSIMLRARCYPILTISDVEKAFLQLTIDKTHRPLCRLIFWKDIKQPLTKNNMRIFEFQRLCFGLKPSPFILQQTLKAHLGRSDPVLGKEIIRDMYVDNITLGAKSNDEAQQKAEKAVELFAAASMKLREFVSNGEISIPEGLRGNREKVKFLGTAWDVAEDAFIVRVPIPRLLQEITMSVILGDIATLYDLLGLAVPLQTRVKSFFQSLWSLKLKWKEPLPQDKREEWIELAREWNGQELRFPRHTPIEDGDHLHVFSDASAMAMGAVVYSVSKNNAYPPMIIAAKGQIAPLNKERTIPQKELVGANIGIRLVETVRRELNKELDVTSWIDNEAVIYWIKSGADKQPVAINNLLKHIWDSSVRHFNYVPTELNPADIISRGCSPAELDGSLLWRHGPEFLTQPREEWPTKLNIRIQGRPFDPSGPEDMLILATASTDINPVIKNVYKYSSLERATRVVQYLMTPFLKRKSRDITSEEIKSRAMTLIHRLDQQVWPPSADQKKDLGIYVDSEGIMRSRGRISKAQLPEDALHPIFIHDKSPLARMVIQQTHEQLRHQGPGTTLHQLRYKYWIPRGKRTTSAVLRHCAQCRLWLAKPFLRPPSEELPKQRVEIQPPFRSIALDMFGPLKVYSGKKSIKRYVIIFTCLVIRAIHLEVANSQSGEDFLLAFRRFKAMRGQPKFVQSDNGSNFKSAFDLIQREYGGMQWKFTDPRSPWQNGAVERLVRTSKMAFYRSKPRFHQLKEVELITVIKEVEAAINQRPLYPRGDNIDSLQPLRPIDFLAPSGYYYMNDRQEVDNYIADPSYIPREERYKRRDERAVDAHGLLERHQAVTHVLEWFWNAWTEEYLMNIRDKERAPRDKLQTRKTPRLGEVVMMETPVKDRSEWPLAVITGILPTRVGADPSYVIVRIRDPQGTDADNSSRFKYQKMPIQQLYPLEADDLGVDKHNNNNEAVVSEGRMKAPSRLLALEQENQASAEAPEIDSSSQRNILDPEETLDRKKEHGSGGERQTQQESHHIAQRRRQRSSRYPEDTYVTYMVVLPSSRGRGGLVDRRQGVVHGDYLCSSRVVEDNMSSEPRKKIVYSEEVEKPRLRSMISTVNGVEYCKKEEKGPSSRRSLVLEDIEAQFYCKPGHGEHKQCTPIILADIFKENTECSEVHSLYQAFAICWIGRMEPRYREEYWERLQRNKDSVRSWLVKENEHLGDRNVRKTSIADAKKAVELNIGHCRITRIWLAEAGLREIKGSNVAEIDQYLIWELDSWRRRTLVSKPIGKIPRNLTSRLVVFATDEIANEIRAEAEARRKRRADESARIRVIPVERSKTLGDRMKAVEYTLSSEVRVVWIAVEGDSNTPEMAFQVLRQLESYYLLDREELLAIFQLIYRGRRELDELEKLRAEMTGRYPFAKFQMVPCKGDSAKTQWDMLKREMESSGYLSTNTYNLRGECSVRRRK